LNKVMLARLLLVLGALLVFAGVSGCNASSPPLSKEEQKDFKGGPPPANFAEYMREKAKVGAGQGQAPGVPGAGPPAGQGAPNGPAANQGTTK